DVLDRKPIHLHLTAGISPFTRLKMETSWLKTLKVEKFLLLYIFTSFPFIQQLINFIDSHPPFSNIF
ncbi:hypothetical protein CAI16_16540, partial [Virgibacillus dokdonensis]